MQKIHIISYQVTELTGRQQVGGQLLDLIQGHIEARRNNAALVKATDQVDNDLASTVVIHDLEVADVAVLLHALQKLNDHLRTRLDQNLPLARLFGVHNVVEAVPQDTNLYHLKTSLLIK